MRLCVVEVEVREEVPACCAEFTGSMVRIVRERARVLLALYLSIA